MLSRHIWQVGRYLFFKPLQNGNRTTPLPLKLKSHQARNNGYTVVASCDGAHLVES